MNYNNFNSFYLCLIFMFGYVLFGVEPFVPTGRLGHSSILVGNKIYFFGGATLQYIKAFATTLDEIFYLDLSQSFSITNPPWTQVPISLPLGSALGTVALDDSNNVDLYRFGGMNNLYMKDDIYSTQNVSLKSLIYKFNINNLAWIALNVSGAILEMRAGIEAVSDKSGKIYIFGGLNISIPNIMFNVLNDMVTFDIASSSWSNTTVKGRALYTATLLPSGVIVYIGGIEAFSGNITFAIMSDISQINLYDTNSLTWSIMSTRNSPIDNRMGHSAVLASNGHIVIYGGTQVTTNINLEQVPRNITFEKPSPDVIVLDTQKNPYEFTAQNVFTNIGTYPSLAGHSANLLGNYMIVAFGGYINQQNVIPILSQNIYVMDITNFTWINTFTLPSPPPPIITSILASVFGVLGGVVCGFFVYRWIKKRGQENNRPGFPGTADSNNGFFVCRWIKKRRQDNNRPGFPGTAD